MSRNWPARDLSLRRCSWDNMGMEQMIETLKRIGLPADEITRVTAYYGSDTDGMKQYVLYMKAMFDDRHEYLD